MRICALPLVLLFAFAFGSCGSNDGRSDPYQVYAAVLRHGIQISPSHLVVAETATWSKPPSDEVRNQLAGLRQDTIDDFLLKNKESVTLGNEFPKDLNVILVPGKQLQEIFAADNAKGWDTLKSRYPGSVGLLHVSQVGFSKDGKQALLFGAGQSGRLGGSGDFVLLNWDGSVWRLAASARLWIS